MKKFKFILPLLAMFLISGTVFGQGQSEKANFAVTVISEEATQATVIVSYTLGTAEVAPVQKTISLFSMTDPPTNFSGVARFYIPPAAVDVMVEVRTNTGEFAGLCLINPWPSTITFDFTN